MVNYPALTKAIEDSGLKMSAVADRLGVTPQGLKNKLNGTTEFKISEVQELCDLLRFTRHQRQQIFFAPKVEKNSTQ